ncbi:MAG: hypothetical protein Q9208_001932 [Pyrenodesmia sp. 3 TL-2023]
MSTATATAPSEPPPWHAGYPPPQCKTPASITPTQLLQALKDGRKKPGVDFLLVDLRRNDFEMFCMRCSSKGRGTRAAGWFDDLIRDRNGTEVLQSLVLEGGITGWVDGGAEFVEWMVEYDEGFWPKPKEERRKA